MCEAKLGKQVYNGQEYSFQKLLFCSDRFGKRNGNSVAFNRDLILRKYNQWLEDGTKVRKRIASRAGILGMHTLAKRSE